MTAYHLAELNIGRIVGDTPDDPRLAEFMAALNEINALAAASPGFVWRLQDDSGAPRAQNNQAARGRLDPPPELHRLIC